MAPCLPLQGLAPSAAGFADGRLLGQLDHLLQRLAPGAACVATSCRVAGWQLQPELAATPAQMAGPYVQLPSKGPWLPVAGTLSGQSDLLLNDSRLPPACRCSRPCSTPAPAVGDGCLAPDEPRPCST